ncbi:MAG TPA: glycosyltransferase family A protein [Solirubrobacteraceae bacterium]|nr:glycosyltransferase family A protein [Solirubrobacteraceae bacterium]
MTETPLVSVVVPVFNGERFLAEALESALAQDHPAFEVIVVDDGSTDGTARVAEGFPVRLLSEPHRGVSAARNAGVKAARGELFTIHDGDDRWPPDRLSRQVAHLREHPDDGIVFGLTEVFLTPGEPRPRHWPRYADGEAVPGHAGTMLARREVFELIGGFDESLWLCEDIDWLARAKDAGVRSGTVEHVVLHYRIHANNSSRNGGANTSVLLDVIRRSVRRQRADG